MDKLTINTWHGDFNKSKRAGGLGAIANFVEHYTGGKGSAKNNCIYFAGGNRGASADFFIDKDGAIWEYNNVLDGYYTWHVGDGKGKYGITNTNSIGVEVVSNGEDFTEAQKAALAALYAHLCSVLGRKLAVVRHYDASRKQCPAPYVDASKWAALRARTEGGSPQASSAAPPQSPTAKPAAKPSTKGDVAKFQQWLNDTYKAGLAVDNSFGPKTRKAAVKALQTELNSQFGRGLVVDGSFGPKTKTACVSVKKGARGNITRILQGMLYCKGCDPAGFDGVFGDGTQAAVGRYQAAHGLTKDYIAGKNTFASLLA